MELDPKKILIVDDEKSIRQGLFCCIKAAGLEPLTAENGKEALAMIHEYRPALIVLDVMMYGLSGLEICRILRNNPRTRKIKIVFLSAKGQLKEQAEGIEAGGDYYMTKPFDYRELIKIIKDLLKTDETREHEK
ncbi:MAG: response regulator [Candidatus Glassbacteria bacterium]|nr:response regulator [Candidatus Glassbacteria bacterium]